MKPPICLLLCFLLLVGCNGEHKLTFESITYSEKECPGCPKVHIEVPKALERTHLSNTINTVLEEELIALLVFDDDIEASGPGFKGPVFVVDFSRAVQGYLHPVKAQGNQLPGYLPVKERAIGDHGKAIASPFTFNIRFERRRDGFDNVNAQ